MSIGGYVGTSNHVHVASRAHIATYAYTKTTVRVPLHFALFETVTEYCNSKSGFRVSIGGYAGT